MFKLAMDSDFRTAITNVMKELKAAGVDVTPEVCLRRIGPYSRLIAFRFQTEHTAADGTTGKEVARHRGDQDVDLQLYLYNRDIQHSGCVLAVPSRSIVGSADCAATLSTVHRSWIQILWRVTSCNAVYPSGSTDVPEVLRGNAVVRSEVSRTDVREWSVECLASVSRPTQAEGERFTPSLHPELPYWAAGCPNVAPPVPGTP
jgi:hypothetical protein